MTQLYPGLRTDPRPAVHGGWYLVAMAAEVRDGLTPLAVAGQRLMLVREGDTVRVAEATCPHRGAHLAVGGTLSRGRVTCPFHGRTVTLGPTGEAGTPGPGLCVPTLPTTQVAGMVLARLDGGKDIDQGEDGDVAPCRDTEAATEIASLLEGLAPVVAVDALLATTPELVVENAFDPEHFATVHHVPGIEGMAAELDADGSRLVVGGGFATLASPWVDPAVRDGARRLLGGDRADFRSGFRATAYSPTLVVTRFGEEQTAPFIVTGAVPVDPDPGRPGRPRCRVRVVLYSDAPADVVARIAAGSRKAIAEDAPVWENLDLEHVPRLTEQDSTVRAFHTFCAGFGAAAR